MAQCVIRRHHEATVELGNADGQMDKLMNAVGDITVTMRLDYFKSLVRSIIGQQISVQAAQTVFGRLAALLENRFEPEAIMNVSAEQLRTAGLSRQKINYMRDLAGKVHDGTIDFNQLADMDNTSVIRQLVQIKGIGKWTAEMFLIFSLGRMDVLAIDDIGIQRGAKWLYDVDKSRRRQILLDKQLVWAPHLTVASLYLWEAIDLGLDKQYRSIDDMM